MALPVFDPPEPPSHPYTVEPQRVYDFSDRKVPGFDSSSKRASIAPLRANLVYMGGESLKDYMESFIHGLEGASGPILWTPVDPVPSPRSLAGVTVDEVAGGSLGARSYTLFFSWRSVANSTETLISPGVAFSPTANNLVRIRVPVYPVPVDGFRVYASDGASIDTEVQATVQNSRYWTEPTGGLIAGIAAPSTNNLLGQRRWQIETYGGIQKVPNHPLKWRTSISLSEVFV